MLSDATPAPPPRLVLMLKAPRLGTVKTRLAAVLGPEQATWIYRALVERQLAAVPTEWAVEVFYAPADAEVEMRAWLGPGPHLVAQAEGDLGERLEAAVADALARSPGGVLVVGGDCPGLDATILREAARALETHDVVLGPAGDGGYYLIGLRSARPELFRGIAWSTERVLAQTVAKAEADACSVALQQKLDDVDTVEDWRRCVASFPDLARADGGD